MTLIPLDPPPGIFSDDTTFATTGRWADGNNVRFEGGKPRHVGGSTNVGVANLGSINRLFIFPIGSNVGVAIGSADELNVSTLNVANVDATPADWGASNTGTSFAMWGTELLANPSGGKLYTWTGAGLAVEIANAPDEITTILVTPERQVLALGCNEEASGTFNGLCIRGCDIEDYTDWTTTSSNNAFEHILEGGGEIVGAVMTSNGVAVFTATALYFGQFIGDPGQTYRFDRVASTGLVGLNAVTTHAGTLYWIAPDLNLRMWAPGSLPVVIPCPISRDFIDNARAASRSKIFACASSRSEEIWIFYSDSRDVSTGCTRYLLYSMRESERAQSPVWSRGQLERSALADSALLLDNSTGIASFNTTLLAGAATGAFFAHDRQDAGALSNAYITSADQYINESQKRMMIRSFIPDLEINNGLTLTLFVRDRPTSTPLTKGPYTVLSTASKKDFRASGKIMSAKLTWDDPTKIGKCLFDAVPMGDR